MKLNIKYVAELYKAEIHQSWMSCSQTSASRTRISDLACLSLLGSEGITLPILDCHQNAASWAIQLFCSLVLSTRHH